MPFASIVESLLPALVIIAVGYLLARWKGLTTAPLSTLLRYVFLPVYLFMTLKTRMSFETFSYVASIGAAVVWAGFLIYRNAHRVFKTQVDTSVAIPNVICFSIPIFALSLGGRGIGTACSFYVGVSIAAFLVEKKEIMKLLREPWLYAVVAGMIFKETLASVQLLDVILSPLVDVTYPLLLLFLGASLYPFGAFKDLNDWVTAVLRVVVGFLVTLLGISILPISQAVATAVLMAALAPPASKYLSLLGSAKDEQSSRGAANVGLLVSLMALILFLMIDWQPPW